MLLTIAIPAYGRPDTLKFALDRFIEQIEGKLDREVEVIVTDDASPGDALAFVRDLAAKYSFLTYRRHKENIGLEQNLIAATQGAAGEYVWIFGDDDYLEFDAALEEVLVHLRTKRYDMLVLNRTRRSNDLAKLLSDNWMNLEDDHDYPGLRAFCLEFGLISVIGFISVNILRRAAFQAVDLSKYFGTMYPQLGAMMEAFHNRPLRLLARPLVCHRTQTPVEKKAALANKATESDFMTDVQRRNALYFSHKLIAMLRELIACGALLPADIVRIRENTVITGLLIQFLLESLQKSLSYPDRFTDDEWRTSLEFLRGLELNSVQRGFLQSIAAERKVRSGTRPARDTHKPVAKQKAASAKLGIISVITPSYNQGKFLKECLRSVQNQTYRPIEHFVYDPGSTDGSREVAAKFKNVTLLAEPDNGQSDALNKGFRRVRGDIIAWLNSDDVFANRNVFKRVIDRFNKPDAPDIVYGKGIFIDENGARLRDVYVNKDPSTLSWRFQQEDGILQPALFMRRSVVEKIGELDGSLHYSMDYQYWIRCVKAGLKFAYVDENFAFARYHKSNKTYGERGASYEEVCRMMTDQFGYVNHNWLRRYAEFLSEGFDGVLASAKNSQIADQDRLENIYRELLSKYNGSAPVLAMLQQRASQRGFGDTWREMKRLGIAQPAHAMSAILAAGASNGAPVETTAAPGEPADRDRAGALSFAIVTPNYNGAPYIEETIESVLGQNHPCLEYVVVDGASMDGSQAKIGKFLPRLTAYISEPDKGHADAINKGFLRTSGEVMGWINSDDILLPGALEAVQEIFSQHPEVEWMTGRPSTVEAGNAEPRIHPLRKFSRLRFLCGQYRWIQQESTFWRRSLWERAGGRLDESVKLATDFELWLRFFRTAELYSVDLPLGAFRVREGQRSKVFQNEYEAEAHALLVKEFRSLEPEFRATFEMMLPEEPRALEKADIEKNDRLLSICDTPTITIINGKSEMEGEKGRAPAVSRCGGSAPNWREKLCIPDDLRKLKDIHKGERCFVMGNGPSLNKMDLGLLNGEIVFGCNSIFLLFDRIKWRPAYYTCVDSRVLPDRALEIDQMLQTHPDMLAFFPSVLQEHTGQRRRFPTRTIIPPADNRVYFNEVRNSFDNPPYSMFSPDINERVIQPFTVAVTMLQIANYMGFSEIYLIGCDTNYVVPENAKKEGLTATGKLGLALTSTEDNDLNHFDLRYFGKDKKWHDPQTDMMIEHYRHAKKVFDSLGKRVFNATVGGKLEVFPRVNFESLFSGHGKREQKFEAVTTTPTKNQELLKQERENVVAKLPANLRYPIFLPTERIGLDMQVEGLKAVERLYKTELDVCHRPRLRALKAARTRRRCFVIGNGPSLTKTDLSKLKNEATFATNGFFLKLPELDWSPTYYVVEDHLVAEDRALEINALRGPTKLFPASLGYVLKEAQDTVFFDHRPRKSFPDGFDFSFEADINTYAGGTVTFTCLQLAAYLGYEEIYLIGVDADYAIPKDATISGANRVKEIDMESDDPNHFHPDYFGKGKRWHEPNVHVMLAAYEEARRSCDARGVKIINATVGGKLEVFPRIDYDSLFKETDNFPHLLLIDHTRIGDATATGELKASLFDGWPRDKLMQLFDAGPGEIGVTRSDGSSAVKTIWKGGLQKVIRSIEEFRPDAILYRPAPVLGTESLHEAAMNVMNEFDLPLITWIMDDWPTSLLETGPKTFAGLDADFRSLLDGSRLNLCISEAMSKAFGIRYGKTFTPFANGVDPADWRVAAPSGSQGTVKVRYAGSLAENMTLSSVRLVAKAVEALAEEGMDISFEIKTRDLWRRFAAPHFKEFSHTSFIAADLPRADYRAWLSDADIVVIGYNFDEASKRYVRYSVANKLPECLASGAALLAVGPKDVATMALLSRFDCGARVTKNDSDAVKAALSDLAVSPERRFELAEKAQKVAFSEFDIHRIRADFRAALAAVAEPAEVISIEMPRDVHASVDETAVVARLLGERRGRPHVMLDVGAHFGTSAAYFDRLGWTIHCFEPDSANREKLVARFGAAENVTIDSRAVGERPEKSVSFFTSNESTGISGLSAFRATHKESAKVDVTTVEEIVNQKGITHIDFLKIDVEGFDFSVLKGVPWGRIKPDVIECEFEDAKTLPMGHCWKDIADYLVEQGYSVYVSEWHPIVRYGVAHDWRRVIPYANADVPADAWGNLLAFRKDPGIVSVKTAFEACVRRQNRPEKTEAKRNMVSTASIPPAAKATGLRSRYISAAQVLYRLSPRLYAAARLFKRGAQHFWARRAWAVPLAAILLGLGLLGFHPAVASYRYFFWGGLTLITLLLMASYVVFRLHSLIEQLTDSSRRLHSSMATQKARLSKLDSAAVTHNHLEQMYSRARAISESHLKELEERLNQRAQATERALRALDVGGREHAQKLIDLQKELSVFNQRYGGFDEILNSLREKTEALENSLQKKTEALESSLREKTEALENSLQERAETLESSLRKKTEMLESGLRKKTEVLEENAASMTALVQSATKSAPPNNAALFQSFNRKLQPEHIESFHNEWRKRLSININRQSLGYMANRVCGLEALMHGRLATSVEDIILRTLVAMSVRRSDIEILEIGTLFGVGAAIMHDALAPHFENVNLTLLDPLEGYYNAAQNDILTGQPVSEAVLLHNMRAIGVDQDRLTLIKRLSTEPEAIEAAGRKIYDVLIIDGDHSYAGVKTDFDNYAGFVRLGGYIIIDDYGSEDWPDVTRFVDEEVMSKPDLAHVGTSWRTSVFRVTKRG